MKIVLSGGGTLGPVIPLLAIAEAAKKYHPDWDFVWVGTKNGPEKQIVIEAGLPFFTLFAGKWRRYFSLWNFFDLFRILFGFFQSFIFLWQEKPALLITGGGFVSVPLHLAGWFMGIPSWVHQQDADPGLSNKIMAKMAVKVTTALEEGQKYFAHDKTEWIGNPTRDLSGVDIAEAKKHFNIPIEAPVIFALGGGTGSMQINQWIMEAVPAWSRDWHVIHLSGRERSSELNDRAQTVFPNYHVYKFFTSEMKDAYAAATVVVARAGFATISELAALGKAAVILPMFGTHQEVNAQYLSEHNAAIVLDEKKDNGLKLAQVVRELVENESLRMRLGNRLQQILPRADSQKIVEIIEEIIGE